MTRGLKVAPEPVHVLAGDADKFALHRAVGAFEQLGGDLWIRATSGAGGRGSLPVTDYETAKLWIDS